MDFCFVDTSRTYIGVGSSSAPITILRKIERIAARLAELDFTLRTYNVTDADAAFFNGANQAFGKFEVWLPWPENSGPLPPSHFLPTRDAHQQCDRMDPSYARAPEPSKKLRARTASLLFGPDTEHHAAFILCWTPDGCENIHQITRTTGEIESIFTMKPTYSIPVFNLYREDAMQRLTLFVEKLKNIPALQPEQLHSFVDQLNNSQYIKDLSQQFGVRSSTISTISEL